MIADDTPPRFELLRRDIEAGIGRLMLDRPARLNALLPALMHEIIAASRWLTTLPDLRILALGGEGRAFCAGFDLDAMRGAQRPIDREATDLGRRLVEAVEAIPAITLATVRGHCIGGGDVLLAAACDLRIGAADARFSSPEMEDRLCSGAGSEADADALVAAHRDPETQAMQQRCNAAHRG